MRCNRIAALLVSFCLALLLVAPEGRADPPGRLWQAQGFDINDLLKGGQNPLPPQDPADLMRGLPPSRAPEADDPVQPPATRFPDAVLLGEWTGRAPHCTDRRFAFVRSEEGYRGLGKRLDPIDGFTEVIRLDATPSTVLDDAPHPEAPDALSGYARVYPARITRQDAKGAVLDMVKDWPVHLIVAHMPDRAGFILRFAEPISICSYLREPLEGRQD
ncbi:hypothetical protein KUW09_08650 [Mameliella alba]|nr:hypothetical protein [Antarctobacter heliothermus]MBY6144105.1 hypothetical protein [Mameliella alba]MCA0954154.1 hypothetical protein [Mameliella alba]